MESGGGRAETLTSVHSTLRDSFLASDLAENHQIPRSLAGLTLAAVLNNERKSTSNSNVVRTLLDIIRTEETLANHPTRHHFTGKKTWKSFKERLKLRRNGSHPTGSHHDQSSWMSTAPVPQSDLMVPASRTSLRDSLRNSSSGRADSFGAEAVPADDMTMRENSDQRSTSMRLSAALAAERELARNRLSSELEGGGDDNGGDQGLPSTSAEPAEEEPIRMSLMDLLEETDRQAGIQGPTYRLDEDQEGGGDKEDDKEEEEEEGKGGDGGGVGEVSCCVCMVRHKGAAFIPCGHTFCRMCSRELWVQRGHCPLCNNFILEILDIF